MNNAKQFKEIIKSLRKLEGVSPSKKFKARFDLVLSGAIQKKQKSTIFSTTPARMALLSIALFLFGTSGLVVAAENAKPESLLYPIKQAIQNVEDVLVSKPHARTTLNLEEAEIKKVDRDNPANNMNENKQIEKPQDNKEDKATGFYNSNERNIQVTVTGYSNGNQLEVLQRVIGTAPDQARDGLERAIEASQKAEVRGAEDRKKEIKAEKEKN